MRALAPLLLFISILSLAQGNLEILSSKRERICLNGRWEFMPAKDENSLPQSSWGIILVPGTWDGNWRLPGLITKGEGPAWRDVDLSMLGRAWYRKIVSIPENWKGKAILLTLGRVSTDAIVFANGVECGRVEWPYGSVDITKAIEPGKKAEIRILVSAGGDEKEASDLLNLRNPKYTTDSQLETKGLIGEVFLECRPVGAHIDDVFIQTSVREKSLRLEIEISDITMKDEVEIIARLLNEQGKEEKRFQARGKLSGNQSEKLEVSWRWDNPRLWAFRQPNLYKLLLHIKGKEIDDEWGETFGFREFWIDGKKFFLNGKEIRLRPDEAGDVWNSCAGVTEVIEAMLEGELATGFNIIELWPWNHDVRGSTHFRELWCEIADRKGILVMAPALDMAPYITWGDLNHWWQAGVKETYEKRMFAELRRYRNHPSVVMWTTTANFAGYDWQDQNPRYIGRKNWYEGKNPSADKHWKAIREGIALIKKYDPTRPVIVHHGVYNGDVFAPNTYLNLIPLQEREEWLSHWVRYGDMPYLPIEFGTPLTTTFMRGRDGYGNAIISEPWVTEFCAIYLGKKAYELETDEYRREIVNHYQGNQLYASWQGHPALAGSPALQILESLFIQNTWRSWRTWGITGGMVPWRDGIFWQEKSGEVKIPFQEGKRGEYRETIPISLLYYRRPEGNIIHPAMETLEKVDGPTLAWITGPEEAFTAKDHNFYAGQKIRKQIVLINDDRKTLSYNFHWEASLGQKLLAKGEKKGRIEPATNLFFPIEIPLPAKLPSYKVEGKILLKARIGDYEHSDVFSFRAFQQISKRKEEIWLFDPVGETSNLLEKLGYDVKLIKENLPPGVSRIVIGRKVLSHNFKLPFDLRNFLQNGGRALVMSQDPEWFRQYLGLRVARHLSRRVFVVNSSHQAVKGLDDEDLRDWNGISKLVEEYPEYPMEQIPPYGWHWGNRGAITSAAIEEPHRSGWRPILECEFDLAYSPLMELNYGKGLLILCTLDLEDHALLDPACNRLTYQLIEYLQKGEIDFRKEQKVIYIGGEKWARLLNFLGVNYQMDNDLNREAGLVIIGSDAKIDEEKLREYIENGGKVLFLPRENPEAPLGVKLAKNGRFLGSLNVPSWEECSGLSPSDLHWRADYSAWLITGGCEVGADGLLGRVKIGKGVAIYSQIDPFRFNSMERVRNGDFSSQLDGWALGQYGTAKADIQVDNLVPEELRKTNPSAKSARITVSQASDQTWHIQFRQPVGRIEAGKSYSLSFWAKADRDCRAVVALIMDHEPFNVVDFSTTLNLSTEWKFFHFTINATRDEKVRVEFQLAIQPATYWLTAISFQPIGEGISDEIVATYFRFTRWRETRALSQILSNLGASFKSDDIFFSPMPREISLPNKWQYQITLELPPSNSPEKVHSDPGISEKAKELIENPSEKGWKETNVPGLLREFQEIDGEAVFRATVEIPAQWQGRDLLLSLGAIDDFDSTFFNGELVGSTDNRTPNWWSAPRTYTIPGRLVKAGKNTITVRVFDNYGGGGFAGKAQEMKIKLKEPPFPVDFYHPDYISDFPLGDDPYRYYRW